jgi:hypothetical protein
MIGAPGNQFVVLPDKCDPLCEIGDTKIYQQFGLFSDYKPPLRPDAGPFSSRHSAQLFERAPSI